MLHNPASSVVFVVVIIRGIQPSKVSTEKAEVISGSIQISCSISSEPQKLVADNFTV